MFRNYIKILGTLVLAVVIFFTVFPESIFYIGISNIPLIWQTAILFYGITLISFFLLSKVWPNYFIFWRKFFWIYLLISIIVIFSTAESTPDLGIFSSPDREGVTWYLNQVFVLLSVCLILFRFLCVHLSKIFPFNIKITRKTFLKKITLTIVSFFVIYLISSQMQFFTTPLFFNEDMINVLFSTFFIGTILILHIIYVIYLCFLRLNDTRYSKKWLFLFGIPFIFLIVFIDMGPFFFLLTSPIYLIYLIILSILPSSSKSNIDIITEEK